MFINKVFLFSFFVKVRDFVSKIKFFDGKLCDIKENINSGGCVAFPSFCDVHVHFRTPGFEYKETIEAGSLAAACGGYTDVCTVLIVLII